MSRRTKYFVVTEGSDRGILRNTLNAAIGKKKTLAKYNPGKQIHIFKAEKITEDEMNDKNRV